MNNEFVKKIYTLVMSNKLLSIILIFLIWIAFFDSSSFYYRFKLQHDIAKMKEEKEYYLTRIAEDSTRLQQLKSNKDNLERFVREKYLMKADNEDVFVIVEETED